MSATDLRSTDTNTRPAVAISATSTPVLSYALAHNRVPVVSRLAFTNHGGAVRAATVRLGVRDAEGPIGTAVELLVDLDAGQTTVLSDVGLVMDPAAMLQIEEQRPGSIEIDLLVDGEDVAGTAVPVQVLAANQWLAAPVPLALEMLAAHVLPNHPAVSALIDEASALLEKRTGSASVQGYQSGPERVDEIVAALTEAMRRRGIRYSEPPASWADVGQKVRTPGDVLDGRVGTCLDTVVVLAAALEQAGIRPLLWLAEGHAFLGYWREERGAESAATTDVAPLVNLVDLGLVRLVETTLLTSRARDDEPQDLHSPAYDAWLTGDLDRVLGVTDVHRARRDGIVPLPARTRGPDGAVQVFEYRPAQHSVAARPVERVPAPAQPGRTETPARVQQWKNSLLDLSLRNRLINYSERAGLPLAVPAAHLGTLEDLLHAGTAVQLLPSDRIAAVQRERGLRSAAELPADVLAELLVERKSVHADVTEGGYLPRLRNLAYKAKTVREETGANNLYLALGSLAWELDGRPLRSPLVLVPVTLTPTSRNGVYRLTLDDTGTSTPNYCLLEKLRQVHGLTVPGLTEPAEDGAGIDLDRALQAMRQALADAALPYRVEPTADLAVLQFAKFRLWKDLDEHWADFTANPLVAHLVHEPTEAFTDPAPDTAGRVDLDELAAQCPVPADASQLRAVAEAGAGRTFVLEGPPGTGKSQTITNLLTRAVADGKRVLFVAEKRAALDVVARRLEAVGMAPFALDLHDKGSKTSVVRAQIKAALEHAVVVDEQGLAADGEDLRSARRTLARYADRLHAENATGLSYYSARTAVLAVRDGVPAMPLPATFVAGASAETMTAVRRALALLPDIADLVRPSPQHAWAFVDTAQVDLLAAQQAAAAVDAAIRELPAEAHLARALREVRTPEDLGALAHLLSGPATSLDVLDEVPTERWTTATASVLGEVAAFAGAVHPGLELATPAALELPLAELYVAAQTAQAGRWMARRKGLRAVRDQLAPVLRPGVKVKLADVPELTAALWRVQTAAQGIAARASVIPGLAVPAGWNPLVDPALLDGQVAWLRAAGAAADRDGEFAAALRRWVVQGPGPDAATGAAVARLRDAVTALLRVCSTGSRQLARWAGDDGLVLRWHMTRPERGVEHTGLMSLRRWADFIDTLEPLRTAGLHEARALLVSGELLADDAVRAFEHGVALASVTERRAASGLDGFDADVHQKAITRFTAASKAVREHLRSALPGAVLAARPFDAASGNGQVGALQRELAKSRRGLGVRGLLAQYGELVTAVMPCVLVSPDSVARFFPAEAGLFDLVVFDEASQIRVADAVGALGRAKAAVVVGDSRQMPPTSFAEPSSGSAEDDAIELLGTAVEDEESILSECVQARVPRQWLSWHYRSQDESLIAFSNANYYDNRLSSFPAPTHGRPSADVDGRGISLVRVNGTFHRSGAGRLLRTNPMEAKAVVAEIRRRFDAWQAGEDGSLPSIGVITFNVQQRAYIEGLLRDAGDDRLVEALDRTDGEGLFVKNLENVQGDERDVVLFSTGFSVNDRGFLPLNFGPLNRVGGERRLNVAVTRARRQVVVFSSFEPSQLRAEQTSSVGIKHLRAYLDLAALGTDALPRDARPVAVPDRHREEIAAALRDRGLVVRTDVGLSEFRVDLSVARAEAPDAPVMAVLLDGPAWARRRTVGDRDGLPVDVLAGMLRWPAVERVWLPTWLRDRAAVLDRLVAAVPAPDLPARAAEMAISAAPAHIEEAAVVAPPVDVVPPVPAPAEPPATELKSAVPLRATTPVVVEVAAPVADVPQAAVVVEPTDGEPAVPTPVVDTAPTKPARRTPRKTASPLDGELPFVPWVPKTAGDRKVLDSLSDARIARTVKRVLTTGLKAEGPVHRDRLARLTASAFGLTRVSEARRDALLALLPPATLVGEFVWPEALDRDTWPAFRRQAASADRPLEHVAPEEVGNAMVALCRASAGMTPDELFLRTAEVFGYRRRTPSLLPLLEAALARVLDAGRLSRQDSGLLTVAA
ncbi:DUF4011 domain-containing protein [Geodermatophilus sabuli]|uniref:Part of AAA domain-containing protein n=1 Tax=Geodermatophilus sabuli TaxID=1564158 RepID=A0A285EES3_9ACTN|nr:DUF4011 domain-containing protein [Geodermatophilus sabuli]MBB3086706.1 hypothetical protein [Geodermatophilus sabuli]SNX97642.1 Part of AAA domain-containing protein [Geodermatophilus sabuli]